MLTKAHFKKILKLLGPNGENWTQHTSARAKKGWRVKSNSRHAARWCLYGAILKTTPLTVRPLMYAAFFETLKGNSFVDFNDRCKSFAPVRQLIEKTMERYE